MIKQIALSEIEAKYNRQNFKATDFNMFMYNHCNNILENENARLIEITEGGEVVYKFYDYKMKVVR